MRMRERGAWKGLVIVVIPRQALLTLRTDKVKKEGLCCVLCRCCVAAFRMLASGP